MLQVEDAGCLIAFITRSAVNVRAISNCFLLVSLVTNRVCLEEVWLPSFEVLYCWLNLVAMKVIASISASRFALTSIPLIVQFSTTWAGLSFGPWFQQSLSIFSVSAHKYGSGCLYSIVAVQVRWGLFYGGHVVSSSRPVPLLVHVPHGVCDIQ